MLRPNVLSLILLFIVMISTLGFHKSFVKEEHPPTPSSCRDLLLVQRTVEPKGELIFPLQNLHAHGSCIVECPNGDLLSCWYIGSGERSADDVKVMGSRMKKGTAKWSEPFLMADTPGFP